VEVPITSLDCSDPHHPKRFGCLPGREIVAGQRGLRLDSCKGDSGGPLYIRKTKGEYSLLGATSRGARESFTTCGDGGIYVRVDLCLDWIREVTGVNIAGPHI
jgi:secreted trypsin-like serine protease